jgi:hypothetical protein
MSELLSYRGRTVTRDDVILIKDLISNYPKEGRTALSRRLCRAWGWAQLNGQLKDMVCRGLLLRLEQEGHIVLPPPKNKISSTPRKRKRSEPVSVDNTPMDVSLKKIRSCLRIEQVRRTPHEKIFNGLVEHYHYLAYAQPVGEHLKYIIYYEERPIGCLAFSSAAFGLNARDHFIG